MEIIKPPRQTFMAQFPRFESASRDSTAIMAAKTCKRYYFYRIVLGFVAKEKLQFFKFGSAYHKFRELLETGKEADPQKKYESAILAALNLYGNQDPPVGSKFDFLTRERLLKVCKKAKVYRDREAASGNIKVIGVPEQPFEVLLKDGKTRRGGKFDQNLLITGRKAVRDFKTSSKDPRFFERNLDPNDQFTGYLVGASKLSGEFVGMLMVEVMYNTRTEGPIIKPFTATRTPWQLDKWEEEQILYEEILSVCRDKDVWPMEEKHCPFCEYRMVCKAGTEVAQMSQLSTEFTQKAWDYKTLGEDSE